MLLSDDNTEVRNTFIPCFELLACYSAAASAALVLKNDSDQSVNYDLTTANGMFNATNALANANFTIFTKGLAGFYSFSEVFTQDVNCSDGNFNTVFLDTLRSNFGFTDNIVTILNEILTGISHDLLNFVMSDHKADGIVESTSTISRAICSCSCDKNSFDILSATTKLLVVSISGSSVTHTKTGKNGKGPVVTNFVMSCIQTSSILLFWRTKTRSRRC